MIWHFTDEAVEIQVMTCDQALKVSSYGITTLSDRVDAQIQVF